MSGGVIIVTISNVVEKKMEEYSFLQVAMNKDIISYTLLAKYLRYDIEKELQKKVKPSAIIMALRRYSESIEKKEKEMEPFVFKNIILKTDVCYVVTDGSQDTLDALQNIHNEVDFKHGDIFNIIQGNFEISVITNKKYKEQLIDLIGKEKIKSSVDDHVSVSLLYTNDYSFTPGILYNISRNIAWENINILTFFHTPTEFFLIVHQDDAMKCYNILEKMLKNNKEINNYKNNNILITR